ncbi:hypothetical protein BD289DRAFT_3492 [Coniella lustricola]|uniref:Uncharacterized protein n=1 Tax=Coniella lustricola TaxID=2025994 RepID=A0A2T3ANL4_9PEZI|nr:hypothetical protein BD289DRAFT_3492 [Coniella lustricola]
MSTANSAGAKQRPAAPLPTLPPNVSIFTPKSPSTVQTLLATATASDETNSAVFTRLAVSATTTPEKLNDALESISPSPDSRSEQEFHLRHGNAVLVFDSAAATGGDADGEDETDEEDGQQKIEEAVKDSHHEHVRAVCLAFKDRDIGLDIAGCVFDASQAPQAGFQFDRLSDGALMVVDLMHNDGDSDDDDEDDDGDDDEADLAKLLAGAEVIS